MVIEYSSNLACTVSLGVLGIPDGQLSNGLVSTHTDEIGQGRA